MIDDDDIASVRYEWRVVRGDGEPVPILTGLSSFDGAVQTLYDRRKNGKMGPYSLQWRVVTYSSWEPAEGYEEDF